MCTTHGGALPGVKKAAKERLQELVDPFITELRRIVLDPNTEDAVKVRGIIAILDRTGHGPGSKLEIGVSKFDEALSTAFDLDPETGLPRAGVDRSTLLPSTRRTLPSVGGGDDDDDSAEQHSLDEQARQWAEYDAEDERPYATRLGGGDVVRGEVVDPAQSRYDVPPDRPLNAPPRYVDEEAREADRRGG